MPWRNAVLSPGIPEGPSQQTRRGKTEVRPPTRYYINPTAINFYRLNPSGTVTACPYKGTTSRYWSVAPAKGTP